MVKNITKNYEIFEEIYISFDGQYCDVKSSEFLYQLISILISIDIKIVYSLKL